MRRQTCARPRAALGGTAKTKESISKRGGSAAQKKKGIIVRGSTTYKKGYDSSQMQQLIGMTALSERHALNANSSQVKRESSQLATLGKIKRETNKIHSEVPEAFAGIVPPDHPFTCCSIFESILRGKFPPLYDMNGLYVL